MLNLLGEYSSTLDSKGRVLLPAALKKQLGGEEAKGFVVNREVFSPCLVLYPMDEWERTSADVRRLSRFDPDNVDFQRRFLNGATQLELDANGRLLLPKQLMPYAHLSKSILFLGVGDRIEIWNVEQYNKALGGKVDFKALAAKVMAPHKTNGQ